MTVLKPMYGADGPRYPCRQMPTRHCPAVYDDECGELRPCARFESHDPEPWYPETEEGGPEEP